MKKLAAIIFMVTIMLVPVPTAAKTIDMGEFKLTAYCPCWECSEGYGRKTSTQTYARSEHTIAVDPDIIDYGSKVRIGKKTYVAEDCGGAVCGDHIDIFVDTHEEVEEFGVKYRQVKIVR